jgi:hypothetical protein
MDINKDQLIEAAKITGDVNLQDLVVLSQLDSIEQVKEFLRCKKDPVYFMERYMTIDGKPIHLRDYQKDFIKAFDNAKTKPWWTYCDTFGVQWWGPSFPMPKLCDNPACKNCKVQEETRKGLAEIEQEFTRRLLFGEKKQTMKKFICWYAYKGMETEGRLDLEEPVIIDAVDMAEAMWKWHHRKTPDWGEKFYDGDIEKYRKKGEFTGWGCWCKELATDDNRTNEVAQLVVDVLNHLNDNQAQINEDGDLLVYVKNYLKEK